MKRFAQLLLASALLVSACQFVIYVPRMPEQVASHFDGAGTPNGLMSRNSFATFLAMLTFGMPLLIATVSQVAKRLPKEMINLPNKEYWLADERRVSSLEFTQNSLTMIAGLTACLFVLVNQLTFQANLAKEPLNTRVAMIGLVVFLLGVFSTVVHMVWHFAVIPKDSSAST